ncbi:hypothetical protein [Stutzerimonas stutzeri]|uniref:hypothetical protein n=1 Tax=Stutzerimonas stutzeri TaxID=316 RepID=UPI002446E265|nr:hypothetical protein [Stutzerimonas stutzeri]MDH0426621.1 hypothetical protein [Stutzerimonas stutzeri]
MEADISQQSDWEVMLNGNPQDLRQLSEAGISIDYFRIWGGIDHWHDCPNDHFSFNSLYFENEQDLEVVWQVSYELVSLFNGASELYWQGYRKLSIHSINFREKPIVFSEKAAVSGLLQRPAISLRKRDEELTNAFKTSSRLGLLVLATENDDVYMILKYLDLDRSWANYYKLMETVDSHTALKKLQITDFSAERKRFTNTANNFSLAGFDSRHGFKQIVKENKTPSMKLEEAHAYVTGLCKRYLQAAYPRYCC